MRILVGITSFGTKNDPYLSVLMNEYRSMRYEVDIVIFSNVSRQQDGARVVVGLPAENPWSLPFAHKRYFAEHADDYDLFIYTENDILIRESNIEAFLRATRMLPGDRLAGFMLYEDDPVHGKNHVDVHGAFRWEPGSVLKAGGRIFAHFTNEHSACYLLTREQLKKAVASGGYLGLPREGRYDMLCTAATDPYTSCGFTKVVCVSHFDDFALHHLPDAYVGRFGIAEREFQAQLRALLDIAEGRRPRTGFFDAVAAHPSWSGAVRYYDPCDPSVLQRIPGDVRTVLSVGCGSGETEARLVERGLECSCIPLDSVVGAGAGTKGFRVLPPDPGRAAQELQGTTYDCVLMLNILQQVADPAALITLCSRLLRPGGLLIGTMPTEDPIGAFFPKRYRTGAGSDRVRYYRVQDVLAGGCRMLGSKMAGCFSASGGDRPSKGSLTRWMKLSGMEVCALDHVTDHLSPKRRRLAAGPLKQFFSDRLIFVCRNGSGRDQAARASFSARSQARPGA